MTQSSGPVRAAACLFAGALLFYGVSCGKKSSELDANAPVSATYSSISSVILTPGCVSCHGGSGGYSFNTYANTLAAVSAGNPSGSPLYTSISSGRMPKDGTHPSAAQLAVISDWITAGALNN